MAPLHATEANFAARKKRNVLLGLACRRVVLVAVTTIISSVEYRSQRGRRSFSIYSQLGLAGTQSGDESVKRWPSGLMRRAGALRSGT